MLYKIFGTPTHGPCPSEKVEMASFFNKLRAEQPSYARIAIHVRNEGLRSAMQVQAIKFDGGFVKGASDIIIPGAPTFVCEMKSRAKTTKLSPEQITYLEAAANAGAFACVALGAVAAYTAFEEWLACAKK